MAYATTVQADNKPKTQEEISQYIQQGAGAQSGAQTGTEAKPVSQQTTQPQQPQQPATQQQPASTTNAQAAAGAQNQAGNSTAGTTPPAGSTGSTLPAYAAAYNFWQNNSAPAGPGANTIYKAPGSVGEMGINPNAPGYDPNAVNAPTWNQPGGSSQAAYDALTQLLSGDASGMDTSAIKNRLKEQRLIMARDEGRSSRQAAAGRGMLDSGQQAADERRIRQGANKDILGGFRDTDIAAAEASVKNKLAGSEALNSLLTGDVGRANVGFQNEFAGKQFEDAQNQFDFQAGQEANKNALAAALGLGGLQQGAAESALKSWAGGADTQLQSRNQDIEVAKNKTNELLGRLGISVNLEEIKAGTTRDKMQFLTDIFRTLVQNEQQNAQLGLNYAQMGQSMNQTMADLVKSIGA